MISIVYIESCRLSRRYNYCYKTTPMWPSTESSQPIPPKPSHPPSPESSRRYTTPSPTPHYLPSDAQNYDTPYTTTPHSPTPTPHATPSSPPSRAPRAGSDGDTTAGSSHARRSRTRLSASSPILAGQRSRLPRSR